MIKNKSLIHAVISKNDTDLLITIASHNGKLHKDDLQNKFAYIQVYIYNPKLYYNESSTENIVEILSNDLGLTKDEINILLDTPCKYTLQENDKVAEIQWYRLWNAEYELLQILKTKTITNLDVTKLKLIAGRLPTECDYEPYKNLSNNEKQMYGIKDLILIDHIETQDQPLGAYLDGLDKAKNILNILYNHSAIVKELEYDIRINTAPDEPSIDLTKDTTDNTLSVTETIIQDGKKYYCNYISFNEVCDEFNQMFKNIDSSIYMTKVIPYKDALDILDNQYTKVYIHDLDTSKRNAVLKDIANRYLKTIENDKSTDIVSSDIILSETETEIINMPECIKNKIPAMDGYNTKVEYVTKNAPTYYPDKEVSNKDSLYLLKEIISGLSMP